MYVHMYFHLFSSFLHTTNRYVHMPILATIIAITTPKPHKVIRICERPEQCYVYAVELPQFLCVDENECGVRTRCDSCNCWSCVSANCIINYFCAAHIVIVVVCVIAISSLIVCADFGKVRHGKH